MHEDIGGRIINPERIIAGIIARNRVGETCRRGHGRGDDLIAACIAQRRDRNDKILQRAGIDRTCGTGDRTDRGLTTASRQRPVQAKIGRQDVHNLRPASNTGRPVIVDAQGECSGLTGDEGRGDDDPRLQIRSRRDGDDLWAIGIIIEVRIAQTNLRHGNIGQRRQRASWNIGIPGQSNSREAGA